LTQRPSSPARPATQRIGVFGGTFNPIHFGHLRSAEEVREEQHLDRVLFVPSNTPPHKGRAELAPAEHRFAMVRRAIAGNPAFRASRIEIDRPGRSFSVETLQALQQRHRRAHLSFILGLDAYQEIATWKDFRTLFRLCDIVVTSRPPQRTIDLQAPIPVVARGDFCYGHSTEELIHQSGNRVVFQRISDLEISATQLRRLFRSGRSVRFLVPTAIERYVARHQLYGVRRDNDT